MRTIMYGVGPKFKKNYLNEPLIMTDHYNLICNILEIEPLDNDGKILYFYILFKFVIKI